MSDRGLREDLEAVQHILHVAIRVLRINMWTQEADRDDGQTP